MLWLISEFAGLEGRDFKLCGWRMWVLWDMENRVTKPLLYLLAVYILRRVLHALHCGYLCLRSTPGRPEALRVLNRAWLDHLPPLNSSVDSLMQP